ncbi:MAG: STAS domain-containing protein [Nitrospira sp.]|nr:STAS domain-containing protein [Nitrospira sp.]
MSMQARERSMPNGIILELTGDLTYANREQFKTAVESVRQRGFRHLVLDMSNVRFIDSSGLGLLALVAQQFKLTQGRLSLLKPQAYVREIMALANIPSLIPMYENEQDAVTSSAKAA